MVTYESDSTRRPFFKLKRYGVKAKNVVGFGPLCFGARVPDIGMSFSI